jgi:L-cysteine desulfidase
LKRTNKRDLTLRRLKEDGNTQERKKIKVKSLITEVFKKEVKTAMGCTEIATIGLVSSLAFNAALDNLSKDLKPVGKIELKNFNRINNIFLTLDPYLFKNAFDVGIPHTNGGRGIKSAATLGLFGDPSMGLQIFDFVSEEHLKVARGLEKYVRIKIKKKWEKQDVYAEAKIKTKGTLGLAIVKHEHDRVVLVESDSKRFFKGGAGRRRKSTLRAA